jgi:hypothetical protein
VTRNETPQAGRKADAKDGKKDSALDQFTVNLNEKAPGRQDRSADRTRP